jgi:hypothetical protein
MGKAIFVGAKMLFRTAAIAGLLIASIPAAGQTIVHIPVDHCDADKCYSPVSQVRADTPSSAARMERVFGPLHGVTFDASKKGGVETEAAGPEHRIRVIEADAGSFKCEWYAKKDKDGSDGLAKGYCWIAIKK